MALFYNEYPVLQQKSKGSGSVWDYAYDRVRLSQEQYISDAVTSVTLKFHAGRAGFTCPNCGNSDPKTVDVVNGPAVARNP